MAFIQGGMRFASASRRNTDSHIPSAQQQAPHSFQSDSRSNSIDHRTHPLRQNGVNYQPNTHMSSSQKPTTAANPRSYAARAQNRPDLSLDTSSPLEYDQPRSPPFSPDNGYGPSSRSLSTNARGPRRGSVPERSPLQKLEVTLGDISKEEKRARVQEAEQFARRGTETGTGARNGDQSNFNGANGDRSVTRKPLPYGSPYAQTSSDPRALDQSKVRRARTTREGGILFPRSGSAISRDRRYGHDATLTGGAAAAAIGVFKSAHDPEDGIESPHSDSSSALEPSRDVLPGRAQYPTPGLQNMQQTSANNVTNRGLNVGAPRAQGQDAAFDSFGPNGGGQQHQNRVGFAHEQPETAGTKGRLRFSGLVHRDRPPTRKYQTTRSLQDWKTAATATLFAQDVDLAVGDHQTWWERSANQPKSQKRSSAATSLGEENLDGDVPRTSFQPPLTLKCGPLLRYTGTRKAQSASASGRWTKFWRGSVMIVTEDDTSANEAPPTLRLFRQPMETHQPQSHMANGAGPQHFSPEELDPIAGHPRCTLNGETVFVKPVNHLQEGLDLSQVEGDGGLFEKNPSTQDFQKVRSRLNKRDGEKLGRYREVKGHRLHMERGVTFWRFNIEVELGCEQMRIAYRVNKGPAIGFWVPAKSQTMNIMFHSCNGFSSSVNPNSFSGPDPLWRDVLGAHQRAPFHVMIGGGDQVYNDVLMKEQNLFSQWLMIRDPDEKHHAEFTEEMQDELERFYLNRYAMWFSQGLFGMANSQIPMVNMWDDHDIIDGYGSYPHDFMSSPVFTGIGSVAFKYYILFQHQSVPDETQEDEPSWILGHERGPYIDEYSRSLYMNLGHECALVSLDCRTERMRDDILSQESYDIIFDRLRHELGQGEIKHLIVLLGVPIAYPRLEFLENVLTSRMMDPVKAMARMGIMKGLFNKLDGGVEVLDDLDDHWTAKHHKNERNWFIEELQELAKERSVRIVILGGDVHLAAVGQFYSNKKLGVPKDHDHRYMPNVISSAIVNTPPPEFMADVINKRNKTHHLNHDTDEDMIPLFTQGVDGKDRNNHHLLPRRNWCSIRSYNGEGEITPPASPVETEEAPPKRRRSFSLPRRNSSGKTSFLRRLSGRAPPSSFRGPTAFEDSQQPYSSSGLDPRVDGPLGRRWSSNDDTIGANTAQDDSFAQARRMPPRAASFHRRPSNASQRSSGTQDASGRGGQIDLEGGLEITINCEVNQIDPSGQTTPYTLIVPALFYQGPDRYQSMPAKKPLSGFLGSMKGRRLSKERPEDPAYSYQSPVVAGATQREGPDSQDGEDCANAGAGNTPADARRDLPTPRGMDGDHTLTHQTSVGTGQERYHTPTAPGQDDGKFRSTLGHLPRAAGDLETEVPYHSNSMRRYPSHETGARNEPLKENEKPQPIHTLHRSFSKDRNQAQAHQMSQPHRQANAALNVPTADQRKQNPQQGDAYLHSQDHHITPVPATGIDLPLGRVGNRVISQPTNVPWNTAEAPWQQKDSGAEERRSVSGPAAMESTSATQPTQQRDSYQSNHQRDSDTSASAGRKGLDAGKRSSATKDPYAHLYPEAVEAEWNSEDEMSPDQEDDESSVDDRNFDDMNNEEFAQRYGHGYGAEPPSNRQSYASAQQYRNSQGGSAPNRASTHLQPPRDVNATGGSPDFVSLPSNDDLALNIPATSNGQRHAAPSKHSSRYYSKPSNLSHTQTYSDTDPDAEISPVSNVEPPPPKSPLRPLSFGTSQRVSNKLQKHFGAPSGSTSRANSASRRRSQQPRQSFGTDGTADDLDDNAYPRNPQTIGMPSSHPTTSYAETEPLPPPGSSYAAARNADGANRIPIPGSFGPGQPGLSEKAAKKLGVTPGVPTGGRGGLEDGFDEYGGRFRKGSGGRWGGFVRRLSGSRGR